MKRLYKIFAIFVIIAVTGGCNDLDVPPMNVVQDKDIFTNENGIIAYMSALYSRMPIDDFRSSVALEDGFNSQDNLNNLNLICGEAMGRSASVVSPARGYWTNGYSVIRYCNYFIQTLPKYVSYFGGSGPKTDSWLGEAYFIRAYTYLALAKRYGGVPIVESVQSFPEMSIEELRTARSSESATFDYIAADLDRAINMLSGSNMRGRANKYAAAALKSRAMLYAASVAKYNQINTFDKNNNQLTGIPRAKAKAYFQAAYDATEVFTGSSYALYKKNFAAGDKFAIADNFANLFLDATHNECIFVKEYGYPNSMHSIDMMYVPFSMHGPDGYSCCLNPTLDLVELFDGMPKNADGTLNTLDENGKYRMFDSPLEFFADCEPRLRGTVILPMQTFKGGVVEIRRAVYKGAIPSDGLAPFLPDRNFTGLYPQQSDFVESIDIDPVRQTIVTLPNGEEIYASGLDGPLGRPGSGGGTRTGFHVRKHLDPARPTALCSGSRSDQPYIDMRYAEVLLDRAEAALELIREGAPVGNLRTEAMRCINLVRERAGATLIAAESELDATESLPIASCFVVAPDRGLQILRVERRKELAFEYKTWWDIKRWRTADLELNSRSMRKLNPFLAFHTATAPGSKGKYFIDCRIEEQNSKFTFQTKWYYEGIPAGELTKNQNLVQNDGY